MEGIKSRCHIVADDEQDFNRAAMSTSSVTQTTSVYKESSPVVAPISFCQNVCTAKTLLQTYQCIFKKKKAYFKNKKYAIESLRCNKVKYFKVFSNLV